MFVRFKGCGAKELITEFPNKSWRLRGLNELLKKLLETGTTAIDNLWITMYLLYTVNHKNVTFYFYHNFD